MDAILYNRIWDFHNVLKDVDKADARGDEFAFLYKDGSHSPRFSRYEYSYQLSWFPVNENEVL